MDQQEWTNMLRQLLAPEEEQLVRSVLEQLPDIQQENPMLMLIQRLCQVAAQRQHDAVLAAELGQSLLEQNQDLARQLLESSQNATNPSQTTNVTDESHVVHLEHSNTMLQQQLDALTQQHQQLHQQHTKLTRTHTQDRQQFQQERDHLTRELDAATEECTRLQREKAQWQEAERKVRERGSQDASVVEKMVAEWEERCVRADALGRQQAGELEQLRAEKLDWEKERLVLREQAAEAQEDRAKVEQLEVELAECKEALLEAHESGQLLSNQLEIYLAKEDPNGPADRGNRSLFSEVDDRRQEWQDQHSTLSQKHEGLKRAHLASIHQQSRMKNHISRLTQLSQNQSASEKVKRLEQTVGQLQAENQQLQSRLCVLEKEGSHSGGGGGLHAIARLQQDTQTTEEVLATLRLQFQQLTLEAESLRKQLRTANMMRLGEVEKCRQVEAKLADCEMELDALRSVNAQFRFDLDEWELRWNLAKEAGWKEGEEEEEEEGKVEEGKLEEEEEPPRKVIKLETGEVPRALISNKEEDEDSAEEEEEKENLPQPVCHLPLETSPMPSLKEPALPPPLDPRPSVPRTVEAGNSGGPKRVVVKRENVQECKQQ